MMKVDEYQEYAQMKLEQVKCEFKAALACATQQLGAIFTKEIAYNEEYMRASIMLDIMSKRARKIFNSGETEAYVTEWITQAATAIFTDMHSTEDSIESIECTLRITVYYDVICPLYGLGYITPTRMKKINEIIFNR